jgi:tetratricopeptide (TPR) repeat protein
MFIGESRREIRDALVRGFNEVSSGSGSQVVVLVSHQGWGKTRIIQEAYRQLAVNHQSDPGYWPPAIVDEDTAETGDFESLTRARKAVSPKYVDAAGVAMDWMWWGVCCEQRSDGRCAEVWREDAIQLYAHANGLMRPPAETLGVRTYEAASALVGVLGMLSVPIVPPVGVAITIVGAAKAGWENRDLRERLEAWWAGHKGAGPDRAELHREEDAEQLVKGLARLTRVRPMLLVVDDAHFADAGLVRIIDGLLREQRARVFLVAAAWPTYLDAAETELPFARWAHEQVRKGTSGYKRVDLDELQDDEVEQVVRAELPAARDLGSYFKEQYGANLLVIRAALRLDDVRHLAEAGRLTPNDLRMLPEDADKVLAAHWDSLPRDVRRVLALAAASESTRYLPGLVAEAYEAGGIVTSPRERLDEAVSPYGWASQIDESLHAFRDPVLHKMAKERTSKLRSEVRQAFHIAILEAARHEDGADVSPSAQKEVLEQHVALARNGSLPADGDAARSAYKLADSAAWRDHRLAIDFGECAVEWADATVEDVELFRWRESIAWWYAGAKEFDKAAGLMEQLIADMKPVVSPRDRQVLMNRRSLAFFVGKAGQPEDAARQLQKLVPDLRLELGATDPEVLRALMDYDTLRLDGSLGEEFPVTLTTRDDLHAILNIDPNEKRYGPDPTYTALMRLRLGSTFEMFKAVREHASSMFQAGRVDEAIDILNKALRFQLKTFQSEDAHTLAARRDLALWLGEAGRTEEAVTKWYELLDAQLQDPEPDYQAMLQTRIFLATFLRLAGRSDEATTVEEVIPPEVLRAVREGLDAALRSSDDSG